VALGPLAGLWLLPHLGFAWMLVILALVFAVLHVLIGSLPRESAREVARETTQEVAPTALFHLPQRSVWGPVSLLLFLGLSFGPMPPYSAQEAKAFGMAWPSALLTCFAIGMMGLRAVLGLTGMGRRPVALLPWMLALAALGSLLLTCLPGGTSRHLTAGLVYGAGYGMVHTLVFMHIIETSRPERRGAAMGALFFAFDVGTALGALALGWVMEQGGFRWGWGTGVILLVLAIPVARRVVRQPRQDDLAPAS
jgi:MFS family permease